MNIDFDNYKLRKGSHKTIEDGACAMEMVAYLANVPHSDHPSCACPSLTAYVMKLNDAFSDEERQLLKPYLKRLIGTRDANSLNRSKVLAHAAITVFAPLALDFVGLKTHAANMRNVIFGDRRGAKAAADAAYSAADAAAYAADCAADCAAAYSAADAAYSAAYAANAAANAADCAAARSARREDVVFAALDALNEALNQFPGENNK